VDRRTKIVATIGPASRDPDCLRELIEAGIDVVRLNFAHGGPGEHTKVTATLREQAEKAGRSVGLLGDLPGPKMRTGAVSGDEVTLETGQSFVLTGEDVEGDSRRVATTVADIGSVCEEGNEIFLADGEIVLRVVACDGRDVVTEVVRGGVLRSRKGMHVPAAERKVQSFTDADRSALDVAVRLKFDYVGLSFIRDAGDVKRVRDALPRRGRRPRLVAKIETRAAVEALDEIIDAADAVMVARGDLGIQTPVTRVPILQKEIIHACNKAGIPVITATQMLESMTHSPIPTRAEVTDVANAVVDGTDALMLSEETAVGDFPVDAVKIMAETARRAEFWPSERAKPQKGDLLGDSVSWAVAHAAVDAAEYLDAAAVVCPTRTGETARRVSAFRPSMTIVGVAERPETVGSMTLLWGVTPLYTTDDGGERRDDGVVDVATTLNAVRTAGLVGEGDLTVVVAGGAGPRAGSTDYMRVARA
jgi:pyruvate kinase